MKHVLLVSGHSDLKNDSVANKTIVEELHKCLPDAELDLLDELYPDFKIDIEAEQQKLVKADIIVLQFPVFWYSQPSLMHRWMEETFKHGFSHGSKGKALIGKKLIASFTTGAPEEAYTKEGAGATLSEMIMPPIAGTARLTGMELQQPIYTCGVSYASRSDTKELARIIKVSKEHAHQLVKLIKTCRV